MTFSVPEFRSMDRRSRDRGEPVASHFIQSPVFVLFGIGFGGLFLFLSIHRVSRKSCLKVESLTGSSMIHMGETLVFAPAFWCSTSRLNLRPMDLMFDGLNPVTRDGYRLFVSILCSCHVVNPQLGFDVGLGDSPSAMNHVVGSRATAAISHIVGQSDLRSLLGSQDKISAQIQQSLHCDLSRSGISIDSVAIAGFQHCRKSSLGYAINQPAARPAKRKPSPTDFVRANI